jgi:hypothetical protein
MPESALLNSSTLYTGEGSGQKIYARAQNLVHQRFVFNTLYQELAELLYPAKANILLIRWPGTLTNQKIFDCTAVQARQRLSSSLQSTLMNDSIPWFDMFSQNPKLMQKENVRRWHAECSDLMFSAMQTSNMAMAMSEAFNDISTFGSALCTEEEAPTNEGGFGGLIFQTYHVSEYVWSCDPYGRVNEVYRQMKMNANDMCEKWGYEYLPKNVQEAYRMGNIDRLFRIIHAVYPREDGNYFGVAHRMPYASVYVCVDSDDKDIVAVSGYKSFPYFTPRWTKANDEDYGRSVAMDALPDIRTLNRLVELELRALVKAVNPFYITDDDGSVGGSITVKPGGIGYIRVGSRFEAVDSKANFQPVNLKKVELQDAVRKAFFIDQLLLPPAQGTPMTATEINRRIEQMYAVMGPEMGRLVSEFLRPIVKRTFQIMLEANALPPIPNELLAEHARTGKPVVDVNFKGPLARSQRMSDTVAIERWMQEIIGPAAQLGGQEILDNVDWDEAVRIGGERLGIPLQVMRKSKDRDALRAQRAKMQQEQSMIQQRNESLTAIGRAAPAIKSLDSAGAAQAVGQGM